MSKPTTPRQLERYLRKRGWVVMRGSGHGKAIHPNGGFVTLPWSPSDHRWVENMMKQIERVERGGGRRAR